MSDERDTTAPTGFPEPPGKDPGDRSHDAEPHHALTAEGQDGRQTGGNELGYRNADEEADYDERGSQGTGAGEPAPDEGEG